MRENMRAVVYREKGVFALEERPVPKLQDPTDAIRPGDPGVHLLQRSAHQGRICAQSGCRGPL